jgi:dipeptidyl aminopeptidase/acylaminoacyl peptidase
MRNRTARRHRITAIGTCAMAFYLVASSRSAVGDGDAGTPERLKLPGETLEVAGRPAFLLLPDESQRVAPQPWVFYAPTLPAYPDEHERWMHEQFLAAGVAVAGIDVGESYGSPAGREIFDAFYSELTSARGFSVKPCLLARSRGGLWMTSWAADHPERVAGLAGIYPVFDLRTYPGLEKAAPAYGLEPAALEQRWAELNPIERVGVLAAARTPALIIHGDMDAVVPLEPNSARFAQIYASAGADEAVRLIVASGRGHDFWDGFFRCRELVDFAIARARAGADVH